MNWWPRTPLTVVWTGTGVTVIGGVMLSDQLSSMPRGAGPGVGELERPDAGDPQGRSGGFVHVDRVAVQGRERTRGPERPREGGRARGDRALRRVVEDRVDEVRAVAAHAREQGDLGPVRRDQDRGEVRIRRERGVELDGDIGDRERAVVARDGQRRVERAGAGRAVAAGMIWPVLVVDGKYCGPEIEPVGPMIWTTWPGVKVLTCIGRSNVTLSVLVVPSVTRLPAAAVAAAAPRWSRPAGRARSAAECFD